MRINLIPALLFASAVSSTPATADETDPFALQTGNHLLALCEAKDGVSWGVCFGFVAGVSRISQADRLQCHPLGVTYGQTLDIVLKGLREHPEERQQDAGMLTLKYLSAAFPCDPPKR